MIVLAFLALISMGFGVNAVTNTDKQVEKLDENTLAYIQNTYEEARGEPKIGQKIVLGVVYNRVQDSRWPSYAEGVVWQRAQFSWTLEADAVPEYPTPTASADKEALQQIAIMALSLRAGVWIPDFTANHYMSPTGLQRDENGRPRVPQWAQCESTVLWECMSYMGAKFRIPDFIVGSHWFYTL